MRIVPKGSDIEILPSANNNSSFKDKQQWIIIVFKKMNLNFPSMAREGKLKSEWKMAATNKSINPAQIRPFQPILSRPGSHFSSRGCWVMTIRMVCIKIVLLMLNIVKSPNDLEICVHSSNFLLVREPLGTFFYFGVAPFYGPFHSSYIGPRGNV